MAWWYVLDSRGTLTKMSKIHLDIEGGQGLILGLDNSIL